MFSAAMKASGGSMPMLCAAVPQKATDVPTQRQSGKNSFILHP